MTEFLGRLQGTSRVWWVLMARVVCFGFSFILFFFLSLAIVRAVVIGRSPGLRFGPDGEEIKKPIKVSEPRSAKPNVPCVLRAFKAI